MQAQRNRLARFEDVLAHETSPSRGRGWGGGKDSRLVPLWDQTREYGTQGIIATPKRAGAWVRAPPQQYDRLLAFRRTVG